jgi:hypothetical protein
LVLAEPLIERIKEKEKDVNLIKVTKLDLSEVSTTSLRDMRLYDNDFELILQHCDFYWAAEAVEWAYTSMLDDIEATRLKYPGEEGEERNEMETETDFRMNVDYQD